MSDWVIVLIEVVYIYCLTKLGLKNYVIAINSYYNNKEKISCNRPNLLKCTWFILEMYIIQCLLIDKLIAELLCQCTPFLEVCN
jgi:hypothetical protein